MYIVSAWYNDSDTDTSRTKRAALIANSRRIGKFSVDSCRCKFQLLRNSRWLEGVSHRFTMCECRPVNTHRDGEEREIECGNLYSNAFKVLCSVFKCVTGKVKTWGEKTNLIRKLEYFSNSVQECTIRPSGYRRGLHLISLFFFFLQWNDFRTNEYACDQYRSIIHYTFGCLQFIRFAWVHITLTLAQEPEKCKIAFHRFYFIALPASVLVPYLPISIQPSRAMSPRRVGRSARCFWVFRKVFLFVSVETGINVSNQSVGKRIIRFPSLSLARWLAATTVDDATPQNMLLIFSDSSFSFFCQHDLHFLWIYLSDESE